MFLQNYHILKEISKSRPIVGYNPSTSVTITNYEGNTVTEEYNIGGYDTYYYGAIYPLETRSVYDGVYTYPPNSSTPVNVAAPPCASHYAGAYSLDVPTFHIVFGSGTTPPSLTDYNIESLISNITFTESNVAVNGNKKFFIYTFRNANNTDITISEVCIFGGIGAIGGYKYNGSYPKCATYRETFSSPLTVPAGASFDYIITIEQNGDD